MHAFVFVVDVTVAMIVVVAYIKGHRRQMSECPRS